MDKNLVQIAIDGYKGHVLGKYSVDDSNEVLRQALIEMNGGSTELDYRAMRRGQANGMFDLLEEIITKTVIEGLPESCPLFNYVETRNLANGDSPIFVLQDNIRFIVSEIADGTQGLRRQRINGGESITVKTSLKGIKFYEELRRVLAKRTDINQMIDAVSDAFTKAITLDMYNSIVAGFDGLVAPYTSGVAGSFSEDKLANIIDHVEAATGAKATILASKQAARKITGVKGADSNSAKEDQYAMGYFGHFYTTPIVVMQNAHKIGSTDFVLNNDLYIIASDDKFVKFVTEGDTLIIPTESVSNADLSQEYLMFQRYGMKCVMADQFGIYKLS